MTLVLINDDHDLTPHSGDNLVWNLGGRGSG